MDRTVLGRKTPNGQRVRVDRFVAPRDYINDVRRRKRRNSCDQKDLDVLFTKYQRKKKYTSYLDYAFGLEPQYQLQDSGPQSPVHTWPCVPRTKSCLSSADSILDLPSYSDASFPELLDWSNDNILVAALGKKYHKWSWWSQSLISQGLAVNKIYCCKFDPSGELLALGTEMQGVEIHNNALTKRVGGACCKCMNMYWNVCSITALDWSPTGNSFASGCSSGVIVSYTRNSQYISWRFTVKKAVILMVRVSPDARHLAVAAVDRANIVLLAWPTLEITSNVMYEDWIIRTAVWHPWRSAFLAVGMVSDDNHTQISLWDAPTFKTSEKALGTKGNSLDAMLFSHRTGEMVLSMLNTESASFPRSCSQLVVMSDPDTVVDRCGEGRAGLDRVRTMVFSPDGTKLATATADEDLIIWNFLPEDEKKKVKKRRFSAIPVYLDETTYGFSFR